MPKSPPTYTLIKGTFHVVGHSPDADSLKFKAADKKAWHKLKNHQRLRFEAGDLVQLRLKGIDGPETHYSKRGFRRGYSQPGGKKATNEFLTILGVKDCSWKDRKAGDGHFIASVRQGRRTVTRKNEDAIPGYIIAREVDWRTRRPYAWVFPSRNPARLKDEQPITLGQLARRFKACANYKLLAKGFAYPLFYADLPENIRAKLAGAAQKAHRERVGLWRDDRTMRGLTIKKPEAITRDHLIYPDLFRRLVEHWEVKKKCTLSGFFANNNPILYVISAGENKKLKEIVEIKKGRLKMKVPPYDIVFGIGRR